MKRPKFGNRKTVVDGVTFDSAKEARRYGELKLLERSGEITGLTLQPRYALHVNGVKVCTYVADFTYEQRRMAGQIDKRVWVVEDVKGFKTPEYRLKAKLFHAVHGFQITEL